MNIGIGIGTVFGQGSRAWTPPIPTPNDALFYLDGTIVLKGSDYYFQDKTSNGRDFLITNYDWQGEYYSTNYGILPFKTKATISAPAGDATLITADTGNFFYDTGGTPIALRPQQFFQNVNYENQIYSREVAHTIFPLDYSEVSLQGVELSPSGLLDITMYSSARTGADIATCATYFGVPTKLTSNVYWVAKSGNDDTGNGSESTPYLTIKKAVTIVNKVSGKTIYVKQGLYTETTEVTIAWNPAGAPDSTLTFQGLGGVQVTSTANAQYSCIFRLTPCNSNLTINFNDLDIIGKNVTNNYNIGGDTITGTKLVILSLVKCNFYSQGGGTYGAQVYVSGPMKLVIDKSCLRGASTEYFRAGAGINIKNSFFNTAKIAGIKDGDYIKYCKIDAEDVTKTYLINSSGCTTIDDNGVINIKYNIFNYGGYAMALLTNDKIATFKIEYNIFNRIYNNVTTTLAIVATSGATTPFDYDLYIRYNKITDLTNQNFTSSYMSIIGTHMRLFDVSYNNFKSTTKYARDGILMGFTAPIGAGCKCNNNYIETNSTAGIGLCTYDSANDANFIGVEVIGNNIIGSLLQYPNDATNHHGILVRGKDCIVKDNYVAYNGLGYVLKSNDSTQSTAVFENNIAYNCYVSFTARALNNIILNNNTFVVQSSAGPLIDIYDQNQESENIIFSNNILYVIQNGQAIPVFIILKDVTYATTVFENNIIKCPNGIDKIFYKRDSAAYVTLADAITAGYSVDNQVAITPAFNDITTGKLWPTTKYSYGKDLGAARKTRLAVDTDWQEVDSKGFYLPSIVTIDDNDDAPKQVGAYGL